MGRTAPLTSKRCILYIYSTNISTEYFKHALHSPFFFSFQNAVCFIMLTCLVPVLFTFYTQGVLKLKKKSGAKGLNTQRIFVALNSPPNHHSWPCAARSLSFQLTHYSRPTNHQSRKLEIPQHGANQTGTEIFQWKSSGIKCKLGVFKTCWIP